MSNRWFPGADDKRFLRLVSGVTSDRAARPDAARYGFAWSRSATGLLIAWAIIVPASADSGSSSFIVGATVVAGCSIALPPAIHAHAIGGPSNQFCSPYDPTFPVAPPQPAVRITKDGATGVETVTLEF
jgi:hypothetical protein